MISKDFKLESERLILSLITQQDEDAIFETMNDKATADIISFMTWPMTKDQAKSWCLKAEEKLQNQSEFLFLASHKETKQPTGAISVHKKDDGAEIGYWVSAGLQGQGYASEMLNIVIRFAFENINTGKLVATAAFSNDPSRHVLEKTGFKQKGKKVLPTAKGIPLECNLFELERSEYVSR